MDHIDKILATDTLNTQYSLSIQAVLMMGKKTLNCSYSKTDLSEVYKIAMGACACTYITLHIYLTILLVLHPQYKL
jgi:hypothetical protein